MFLNLAELRLIVFKLVGLGYCLVAGDCCFGWIELRFRWISAIVIRAESDWRTEYVSGWI